MLRIMESSKSNTPKPKPSESLTEVLPTRRIAFAKQLDLLRSYAAVAASGKPVGNQEVADVVGMSPQTTSLANGFFLACGLIVRGEGGFMPAPEVVKFQRAHQWTPDTAAHEIAPILERTWFAQALKPHLALGPITDSKAMAILGSATNATQHRAAELRLLVEYLEASGLIQREDGHVRAPSPDHSPEPSAAATQPDSPTPEPPTPTMRGGGLPLLIQGLLEQLPQDGHWTRARAKKWLQMAEMTFEIVYELGPDKDDSGSSPEGGEGS